MGGICVAMPQIHPQQYQQPGQQQQYYQQPGQQQQYYQQQPGQQQQYYQQPGQQQQYYQRQPGQQQQYYQQQQYQRPQIQYSPDGMRVGYTHATPSGKRIALQSCINCLLTCRSKAQNFRVEHSPNKKITKEELLDIYTMPKGEICFRSVA